MRWSDCIVFYLSFEFYAVAARQRAVRQFLKRYFKDYREVLADLVQRGIDRGEFRPLRAEHVAIAAFYEGLALLWIVDPDATQWEQTGESSLLLLLDGLAAPR